MLKRHVQKIFVDADFENAALLSGFPTVSWIFDAFSLFVHGFLFDLRHFLKFIPTYKRLSINVHKAVPSFYLLYTGTYLFVLH